MKTNQTKCSVVSIVTFVSVQNPSPNNFYSVSFRSVTKFSNTSHLTKYISLKTPVLSSFLFTLWQRLFWLKLISFRCKRRTWVFRDTCNITKQRNYYSNNNNYICTCICIPSFFMTHHVYFNSVTFAMCIFRVSNRKPED